MKSIKRAAGDLSALAAARVITALLGLVNIILVTKQFNPEEFGRYALFQMVLSVGLTIGVSWSSSSLVRFGREEFEKTGFIRSAFWSRGYPLMGGLLTFLIGGFLFRQEILSYAGIDATLFPLLVISFVSMAMIDHYQRGLQAVGRLRRHALTYVLQMISLTLLLLLMSAGILPATLRFLIGSFTAFNLVGLIVATAFLPHGLILPPRPSRQMVQSVLRYSYPQLIGFSGLYIVNWIDLVVIRQFLGTADVGVYQFAYRFFAAIIGLSMIAGTVLTPMMVGFRTRGEDRMVRRYASDMVPLIALCLGMLLVPGAVIARAALLLLAPAAYEPAIPCLLVLFGAALIRTMSLCLAPVLNAYDRVIEVQLANLAIAGVNIILDFALVPRFGILGAAIATVIAYIVGNAIIIIRMRRLARLDEGKVSWALGISLVGIFTVASQSSILIAAGMAILFFVAFVLAARKLSFVSERMFLLIDMVSMPAWVGSMIRGSLRALGGKSVIANDGDPA